MTPHLLTKFGGRYNGAILSVGVGTKKAKLTKRSIHGLYNAYQWYDFMLFMYMSNINTFFFKAGNIIIIILNRSWQYTQNVHEISEKKQV